MPEKANVPKSKTSPSVEVVARRNSIYREKDPCNEKNLTICTRHKVQLPVQCQRRSANNSINSNYQQQQQQHHYYHQRYQHHPSNYRYSAKGPFNISSPTITKNSYSTCTIKTCPSTSSLSPSCIRSFYSFESTTTNRRRRRSLSLIDLSGLIIDSDSNDIRSDCGSMLSGRSEISSDVGGGEFCEIMENAAKTLKSGGCLSTQDSTISSSFLISGDRAASLVCHALMLNAWRRRRVQVAQLEESIDKLNQQLDHSHLQMIVLRRLFDNEKERVGKLNIDIHRTKSLLDETTRQRDLLKTEKNKTEEELERTTQVSEERSVILENLRNELLTAQNQLQAIDAQLSKEREKLLKLREDKRILLDKVAASEALANERGLKATRAEVAVEDLKTQLTAQIALLESSQEQNQKYFWQLRSREEKQLALEKRLELSEEKSRVLGSRVAALENQLSDRETALRRIESAYNTQLTELNELKDRLVRQSQEGRWSSRMLQLAGSVVRAPRAILRTLSFLSTTGVSLPP